MIMNSTSLYVTITQIILKSNPDDANSWKDLYLLIPYLRNSICCVVCGNLLVHPLTPRKGRCQHHLCQKCTHGRKKIKPACIWCKDCSEYNVNTNLRILLQCYKKMCITLVKSKIFRLLIEAAYNEMRGNDGGSANLIILIKEGASFQDSYESKGGLPKSAYSILPCIYSNSQKYPLTSNSQVTKYNGNITNGDGTRSSYSVMFAETGNKITIKKKTDTSGSKCSPSSIVKNTKSSSALKSKTSLPNQLIKQGCRCGNATLTPGKLTCCGQRCPCYVNSKACQQCKCRGCRNPHESNGNKIVPGLILPETKVDSATELKGIIQIESQYAVEQYTKRPSSFQVSSGNDAFNTIFLNKTQLTDIEDDQKLIFVNI